MSVVTLTTDFGTRDFYVGALKGALWRRFPGLQLIDISHDIKPFDIVQAAYVIQQAAPEFPPGTVHLIGVHCVYDQAYRFVAGRLNGQFFVAPDNGLLSLLLPDWPETDLRALPQSTAHFPVKDSFADAAAHLLHNLPWEELGSPAGPVTQRIRIRPVLTAQRIRGAVIHIDNFENAVVNIHRDEFERARKGRDFSLYFRRHDPINELSTTYSDVPIGEPLCLFNAAGYLEIAVNLGKAATLLGLKLDDVVEAVFLDK